MPLIHSADIQVPVLKFFQASVLHNNSTDTCTGKHKHTYTMNTNTYKERNTGIGNILYKNNLNYKNISR